MSDRDDLDPPADPTPECADKPKDDPLRIVRAADDDDDLDLDVDEAESDRRYGREDIADK